MKQLAQVMDAIQTEQCNTSRDVADATGLRIEIASHYISELLKAGVVRRTGMPFRNINERGMSKPYQAFELVRASDSTRRLADSRSVAAEWGDGLLDADGDTKRLSRLEVGGANPPSRRRIAQQESASQSDAPTFTTLALPRPNREAPHE